MDLARLDRQRDAVEDALRRVGGGRYDGLVKQLGGPAVPAFGWSIGLDRLAMLLQQKLGDAPYRVPAVLIPLGESATLKALVLAGTAAFERKAYAQALVPWQKALERLPPEAETCAGLTAYRNS